MHASKHRSSNPEPFLLRFKIFSKNFEKGVDKSRKVCYNKQVVRRKGSAVIENADMAELADAHGSGPCDSNIMEVQVLLSAPSPHGFVGAFLYAGVV